MRPLLVPIFAMTAFRIAAAQEPGFAEKPLLLVWEESRGVAIGDFDEDGLPDIASLNSTGPYVLECPGPPGPLDCGPQMSLCVAPGRGLGRFGVPACVQTQCAPWTLGTGDFDGDGHLDAVVGNAGARNLGICFRPSLSLFRGNGAGGFSGASHMEIPDEPRGLAVGDLDEDGRPEVVLGLGASGRVEVYHVATGGVLAAGAGLSLGTEAGPVALGDLDGDGHLDAAVSLPADDQVAVLLGTGLGGLMEAERCPTGGDQPRGVAIADFTLGGTPEIAVANQYSALPNESSVAFLTRDGTGTFCGPGGLRIAGVSGHANHLAVADLNEDGYVELAATIGRFEIAFFWNDGTGGVGAQGHVPTSSFADPIAAGDLDQIGGADLVTAGWSISGPAVVSVLVNAWSVADDLMLDVDVDSMSWIGVRDAIHYDVVRGDAHVLSATGGDFAAATDACVADDWVDLYDEFPGEVLPMPDAPPPGGLWWVLARPNSVSGPGSYDAGEPGQVGSRDAGIAASSLACP